MRATVATPCIKSASQCQTLKRHQVLCSEGQISCAAYELTPNAADRLCVLDAAKQTDGPSPKGAKTGSGVFFREVRATSGSD